MASRRDSRSLLSLVMAGIESPPRSRTGFEMFDWRGLRSEARGLALVSRMPMPLGLSEGLGYSASADLPTSGRYYNMINLFYFIY